MVSYVANVAQNEDIFIILHLSMWSGFHSL